MRKPRIKTLLVILTLVVFAFTVVGCGGGTDTPAPAGDEKVKVGFIYIGSPGDASWTFAHEKARQSLVDHLRH